MSKVIIKKEVYSKMSEIAINGLKEKHEIVIIE